MDIYVLFFGVLAEVTGTHRKHYRDIRSYSDLNQKIKDDFPEMFHYSYRIAHNNEIINVDPELRHNDELAFLPPFAGG